MSSPSISIIIPVYKAEATINKCLDSFINQTFNDWELILVDDGSPDSSGRICDDYCERDSRIHVIHQSNSGVSSSRQVGLESSSGIYIIHADSDDWVEPEMLEELFRVATADDADMVICDFYSDDGIHSTYLEQRPTSLDSSVILYDLFGKIHGSCCNKLVKKSCIERFAAHFPAGINYCEDVCFNVQLLKHDIKVSYLNKAFYHYVQSPTSITNNYTTETLKTQKEFVNFLSSLLPDDSYPVTRSKELVKKLAFRYGVLNDDEFDLLYPEIMVSHDPNFMTRTMYNLAFNGHHILAEILRKLYHSIRSYC